MEDDNRTQRYRTADVLSDAGSFNDLLLPQPLVAALAAAGFNRPSPVQKAAIPIARVGSDVIVQAKSGTGKTAVFATILLEKVSMDISTPQALVLAPTRELAIQSYQVIERIAAGLPVPAPVAAVFVGGLPTAEDEKRLRRTCHIVVGTPGRICALVTSGALLLNKLKHIVLDEADQLLGEGFYADMAWLMQQLPSRKQVMAFSATFTAELLADLEPLMKRPQKILLCEETVSLIGIKQYYKLVGSSSSSSAVTPTDAAAAAEASSATDSSTAEEQRQDVQGQQQQQDVQGQQQLLMAKVEALLQLLSTISFHQAVVFCNKKPAAEWLSRRLTASAFPATYLSADLPQTERMAAMEAVRGFRVRIIVSTDVMARGVDFDRVNLVVNLDLPQDAATYVHRVGRTGRFGSRGVAVAAVTAAELSTLQEYLKDVKFGDIAPLPSVIPDDFYSFNLESDWEKTALKELLAAPTATPPASPPPMRKKQQSNKVTVQNDSVTDIEQTEADDYIAAGVEQQQQYWDEAGWQQQQQQRHGDTAAAGYSSSEDAAAAWDAWAQYYRSLGYSYPYANPYRQQQQQQQIQGLPSQQQQQQWHGYHNQQWPHAQQQQQQYWQQYWQQYYGSSHTQQAHRHHTGDSSSSSSATQQQLQHGYADAHECEVECELSEQDHELDSEDDLDVPVTDEECDARAVMLLSKLKITEEAAVAAAISTVDANTKHGSGKQQVPQQRQEQQVIQQQQLPSLKQQNRRWSVPAGAGAAVASEATCGPVCLDCWARAYASWQQDYETWRQQYNAWCYSMQAM